VSVPTATRPAKHTVTLREQWAWQELRDGIGTLLDRYLHTGPSPDSREVVQQIERALAAGDHAVKLLK
jgi:hypothetical protein